MPPKAKPKLTPEEAAAKKKEKREKKKRDQEAKRKKLRHDELTREINYTKLSVKQHEKNWKKMLIRISLPRIREELIFEWQGFERVLDVKDFTISLYMDELDIANEQYLRSIRNQLIAIDDYLHTCNLILDDMKHTYIRDIDDLQEQIHQEIQLINTHYHDDEMFFKVSLYGMMKIRKDSEKILKGDRVSKLDEEFSRMSDILMVMKSDKEKMIHNLIDDFMKTVVNYKFKTSEKRESYNRLYDNDKELKEVTKLYAGKITRMTKRIKKYTEQMQNMQKEHKLTMFQLQAEKSYYKKAYQEMRSIMVLQNAKIRNKMMTMTSSFNKLLDQLTKFADKGENVLNMMMVCGKWKTVREKVLALPLEQPCMDKKAEKRFRNEFPEYESNTLSTFWTQVANTHASAQHYENEKAYLIAQNNILKTKIQEYCQCLTYPTEAVRANPNMCAIDARDVVKKYRFCK